VHQTALSAGSAHNAPAGTLAELQALMEEFDRAFDHQRPHQALGMRAHATALAAAAVAIPPTPVEGPPARDTELTRMLRRRGDANGKIWVDDRSILLGWEYARVEFGVIATARSTATPSAPSHSSPEVHHGSGRPRGGGSHRSRVPD
jgi:hypothetical protein